MSVIVARELPVRDAAPALIPALQAALGDAYAGFTCRKDHIEVFLPDDAPETLRALATQIVLEHDFSLRTEYQIAEAQRREKREMLRKVFRCAEPTTDAEELARRVEWLTLEVLHLLERGGVDVYADTQPSGIATNPIRPHTNIVLATTNSAIPTR